MRGVFPVRDHFLFDCTPFRVRVRGVFPVRDPVLDRVLTPRRREPRFSLPVEPILRPFVHLFVDFRAFGLHASNPH